MEHRQSTVARRRAGVLFIVSSSVREVRFPELFVERLERAGASG
jgi:hypothetical protein